MTRATGGLRSALGKQNCIHLLPSKETRAEQRETEVNQSRESDIGKTRLILPDLFCRIKIRVIWTIWLQHKKGNDGTIPKSKRKQ